MFALILFLILLEGCFDVGSCVDYSNVQRKDPIYNHLGTKSLYFHHPIATAHYPLPMEVDSVAKGFKPIHIDALYRHGTRYPSKEKVCAWKSTLLKIMMFDPRNQTINIIKKWDTYFPEKLTYALHETGWNEMRNLAMQWATLAGSLFDEIAEKFKNDKIHVQKPCNNFDQDKFLSESFSKEIEIFGTLKMKINRNHMRPFDYCRNYVQSVESNISALAEYRAFTNTEEFDEVKEHLSKLFPGSHLKRPDVIALLQLCSFLLVLHENNRICKLFSPEHLKVMEYVNDLRHYYTTGYGHHINYHLVCTLLKDILVKMENVKNKLNDGKPSVVLRFGHAETLIPLLCLIGLYKDEMPLTAASFQFHKEERLFRTGTFSPFAGNIAFVLYRYIHDEEVPLKIAILVNGHYIKLPRFEGCYLCDYDIVRQHFESILDAVHCATVCGNSIVHDEL